MSNHTTAALLIQHYHDLIEADVPPELALDLVKQASHHLLVNDGLCVHIEDPVTA